MPCVRGKRHPQNHQIRDTDFATINHLHHTPWAALQLATTLAADCDVRHVEQPTVAKWLFRCLSAGAYHS